MRKMIIGFVFFSIAMAGLSEPLDLATQSLCETGTVEQIIATKNCTYDGCQEILRVAYACATNDAGRVAVAEKLRPDLFVYLEVRRLVQLKMYYAAVSYFLTTKIEDRTRRSIREAVVAALYCTGIEGMGKAANELNAAYFSTPSCGDSPDAWIASCFDSNLAGPESTLAFYELVLANMKPTEASAKIIGEFRARRGMMKK